MKARRAWSKIFLVPKDYRCQRRVLYPAKMSIIVEGERKMFHDINKLKEFFNKPSLQRVFQAIQRTDDYNQSTPENKYYVYGKKKKNLG